MGSKREIGAEFTAADDLLWQAQAGRLAAIGPLSISPSGKIGPLVEMALARRSYPREYAAVQFAPAFARWVDQALDGGTMSGANAADIAGVFPLSRHDPDAADSFEWDQWAKHAENAATRAGCPRGLLAGLLGALGELQDNVYAHSGRPESGLVAYAASSEAFEFVVADCGMGVLASLRQNEEFAGIDNAGSAMQIAISDGASRLGKNSGRGFGIGQLFRALAHDRGDLRFRSDDYALRLWGDAPSLTGHVEIGQKARLPGFIISVRSDLAPGRPRHNR